MLRWPGTLAGHLLLTSVQPLVEVLMLLADLKHVVRRMRRAGGPRSQKPLTPYLALRECTLVTCLTLWPRLPMHTPSLLGAISPMLVRSSGYFRTATICAASDRRPRIYLRACAIPRRRQTASTKSPASRAHGLQRRYAERLGRSASRRRRRWRPCSPRRRARSPGTRTTRHAERLHFAPSLRSMSPLPAITNARSAPWPAPCGRLDK